MSERPVPSPQPYRDDPRSLVEALRGLERENERLRRAATGLLVAVVLLAAVVAWWLGLMWDG